MSDCGRGQSKFHSCSGSTFGSLEEAIETGQWAAEAAAARLGSELTKGCKGGSSPNPCRVPSSLAAPIMSCPSPQRATGAALRFGDAMGRCNARCRYKCRARHPNPLSHRPASGHHHRQWQQPQQQPTEMTGREMVVVGDRVASTGLFADVRNAKVPAARVRVSFSCAPAAWLLATYR